MKFVCGALSNASILITTTTGHVHCSALDYAPKAGNPSTTPPPASGSTFPDADYFAKASAATGISSTTACTASCVCVFPDLDLFAVCDAQGDVQVLKGGRVLWHTKLGAAVSAACVLTMGRSAAN